MKDEHHTFLYYKKRMYRSSNLILAEEFIKNNYKTASKMYN